VVLMGKMSILMSFQCLIEVMLFGLTAAEHNVVFFDERTEVFGCNVSLYQLDTTTVVTVGKDR